MRIRRLPTRGAHFRLAKALSGRNELAEAGRVRPRVARARDLATGVVVVVRGASQNQVSTLDLLVVVALAQTHDVAERGLRVDEVVALRDDWLEQDDDGQDDGEPEGRCGHDVACRAEEGQVANQVGVHEECEAEVDANAAPSREVVEERPVVGVDGTLRNRVKSKLHAYLPFARTIQTTSHDTALTRSVTAKMSDVATTTLNVLRLAMSVPSGAIEP